MGASQSSLGWALCQVSSASSVSKAVVLFRVRNFCSLSHVWVLALGVLAGVEQIVLRSLFRVEVAAVLFSDGVNVDGESCLSHLLDEEWHALNKQSLVTDRMKITRFDRLCTRI